MKSPSLLIIFDPVNWAPMFHYNAETDQEEARLREIAVRILGTLDDGLVKVREPQREVEG